MKRERERERERERQREREKVIFTLKAVTATPPRAEFMLCTVVQQLDSVS